jgi:outer membrane protein assembly factor BamB
VATLAEEIGAATLITREPGTITVFTDGATTEVATPEDAYAQSDGNFLWWTTYADRPDGAITSHSTAATLDGTIVCEADGEIHRIRQEADGGHVASVERRDEVAGNAEEIAVPNFAVDCETGERQPIETVSWMREAGSRFVQRVGDRTFTGVGDAEGNADMTNEDGISINGDDYAGYHAFSADGSRVAYGDMTAATHVTNMLRSRDTTTGELLWSTELETFVAGLHWYDDRIVALVPGGGVPGVANEAVIVLDALTGDVIKTVPASVDIAFVG